jgi:hypothetical protein
MRADNQTDKHDTEQHREELATITRGELYALVWVSADAEGSRARRCLIELYGAGLRFAERAEPVACESGCSPAHHDPK